MSALQFAFVVMVMMASDIVLGREMHMGRRVTNGAFALVAIIWVGVEVWL